MEFLALTLIGIAAAFVHIVVPGHHHVGPASAFGLGIGGAWGGALFASAFIQGGWAILGWPAGVGGVIGAVGTILSLELIADAYFRHNPDEVQ